MGRLNKRQRREKKRKEKRRKLKKQSPESSSRYRGIELLEVEVPEYVDWPVAGAYFSHPLVFRICGQGLLYFCRQNDKGQFVFLIALLDYFRGGFTGMTLVEKETVTSFQRDFLGEMASKAGHSMRPIAPEAASTLFWGTLGFGHSLGAGQDVELVSICTQFIPPPPGRYREWLQAIQAPEGFLDPRFIEVVRKNQMVHDARDLSKEPVVFTRVEMEIQDQKPLLDFIEHNEPEISETEPAPLAVRRFFFSRAYPKGHWSPFSRIPGQRQHLADLTLSGDILTVESKVASMAARCVQLLDERAPGSFRLRDIAWTDVHELMQSEKGSTSKISRDQEQGEL